MESSVLKNERKLMKGRKEIPFVLENMTNMKTIMTLVSILGLGIILSPVFTTSFVILAVSFFACRYFLRRLSLSNKRYDTYSLLN